MSSQLPCIKQNKSVKRENEKLLSVILIQSRIIWTWQHLGCFRNFLLLIHFTAHEYVQELLHFPSMLDLIAIHCFHHARIFKCLLSLNFKNLEVLHQCHWPSITCGSIFVFALEWKTMLLLLLALINHIFNQICKGIG